MCAVLERIGNALWSPCLLVLFLFCGLLFSVRSGFFQIFGIKTWLGSALRSITTRREGGGFSQLQALATALASTIGTGSIAGVATAIVYGGPGAVFWMWICALLGMMTGFVEKTLSVKYQRKRPDGSYVGGPMRYMQDGLGLVLLPWLFAFFCLCNSFAGGNMVQANSIATTVNAAFGIPRWLIGVVIALLCGAVILGGLSRIGRVSELLVPLMAALYIGGGLVVLFYHRANILPALRLIVQQAFAPRPIVGGAAGYGVVAAMRFGIARGVFTNEAGLGSSAMVHGAARPERPAQQGFLGMLEVCFATLIICSITALVILCSGVYNMEQMLAYRAAGSIPTALLGAPLTTAAFSTVFGAFGGLFISLSLLLFAFTSLLGWSYYGERALAHLLRCDKYGLPPRLLRAYRLCFLIFIFLGSIGDLTQIWLLSDIFNGLMAVPNLIVLISLSGEAFACLRKEPALQKR